MEGSFFHESIGGGTAKVATVKKVSQRRRTPFKKGHPELLSLHQAISYGDKDIIKMLIDAGVDVNGKNSDDETPLHVALNMPLVRASEGDSDKKDEKKFLHVSIYEEDVEMLKLLLSAGADVNEKLPDGETPLHVALVYGDQDIVKEFVRAGADVNAKNELGVTPLFKVLSLRLKEKVKRKIIKTLLNANADVNGKRPDGKTPLHVATTSLESEETFAMLIDAGARATIDERDDDGDAPLHLAVILKNKRIAELLVNAGASVDLRNSEEQTPLQYAINLCEFDIAKFLIRSGADVNTRSSKYGTTPLHFAVEENDHNFIEYLLSRGADVNSADDNEHTPLHIAGILNVGPSHSDVIRLLLKKGADASAQNHKGLTPVDYLRKDPQLDPKLLDLIASYVRADDEKNKSGVTESILHEKDASAAGTEEENLERPIVKEPPKEPAIEEETAENCKEYTGESQRNKLEMERWYRLNRKIEEMMEKIDKHVEAGVYWKAYFQAVFHVLLILTLVLTVFGICSKYNFV